MVTGAYFPELSGGGLQARALVRAFARDAEFAVLTTSADPSLPASADEDGVPIRRVYVDVTSAASRLMAGVRFAAAFAALAGRFDIVNLHGFSSKATLLVALSRVFGKRFVLSLHTSAHDEPAAARAAGAAAFWAYRHADLYLSVSVGLSRAYHDAGFPASRLRQVSNAIDTDRFRPPVEGEREALRRELGLPADRAIVLFVGFFSRDKRPGLLYSAWSASKVRERSALVMIGATRPIHGEVDAALGPSIRQRAERDGYGGRVIFVESTTAIEKYYRAADVYVLPSVREAMPLALLEAMSSGLPCVATRLAGSTDVIIEHDVNGVLVEPDDEHGFAMAIESLLTDRGTAQQLGNAARLTALERYAIERAGLAWMAAYRELATS